MVYSSDRPETDEARRATQARYRHQVQYMIGNPPLWKREIVLRFLNQLYGYRFSQTKITKQDGQPRHMMSHHIMKIGEHCLPSDFVQMWNYPLSFQLIRGYTR